MFHQRLNSICVSDGRKVLYTERLLANCRKTYLESTFLTSTFFGLTNRIVMKSLSLNLHRNSTVGKKLLAPVSCHKAIQIRTLDFSIYSKTI